MSQDAPNTPAPTDDATRWRNLAVGAALIFTVLTLAQVGGYGILGPDEPRYARIAQEMWSRGDWVVPTLKGAPWLEKPPLMYWAMGAAYSVFGVNEFAVRFFSVLTAGLTIGALFFAFRRALGPRPAALAALALSGSLWWVGFSGAGTADIYFSATLTWGLLALWKTIEHLSGAIPENRRPNRAGTLWFCFAGFLFGLACLAKGPLALVIAGLAVLPFLLLTGSLRHLLHWRLLPAAAIFLATALPWFLAIYRREGFHFILVFFINHHLARYFTSIHHHTRPFWFYIPIILGGLLPWTAFPLMACRDLWRHLRANWASPSARALLFALCWLIFPFLFFSASSAKLPGYVLPLFPALALLVGWSLDRFLERTGTPPLYVLLILTVMAAIAIGAPLTFHLRFGLWGPGLWLAGLILPGLAAHLVLLRHGRRPAALLALAAAVWLPLCAAAPLLMAPVEPWFSNRQICRTANRFASPANPLVIYQNQHHTNDYYTGYTCSDNILSPELLRAHLAGRQLPVYVLTKEDGRRTIAALPDWRTEVVAQEGPCFLLRLSGR